MKIQELIKNKTFQIVATVFGISLLAYATRKNWYYPKGITIKNVDKKNKTVDVVFNYDGVLEVLNGYKTDEFTNDIITDLSSKSNYSFGTSNWKGITYFTITDGTKDPKKGEMHIVLEKAIDWSGSGVPYDNTISANAESIASKKGISDAN
jgi:hypothetical protein